MGLIVASALRADVGLQRIKAGRKAPWRRRRWSRWSLGLAAVALQVVQLLNLPFQPGQSGLRQRLRRVLPGGADDPGSAAMVWLEILFMRARIDPGDLVRGAAAHLQ
jgi:hypothetical protein